MRAFSTDKNRQPLLTSKEHKDIKKANVIYNYNLNNLNNKIKQTGPICLAPNGELNKVGGYNIQSYSLLNTYKKGISNLEIKTNNTWDISQSPNYIVTLDISNNLSECSPYKNYYNLSYPN